MILVTDTIYDITTVWGTNPDTFNETLNGSVATYTEQGLRVEVQFSTSTTPKGNIRFAALVIAYKAAPE